MSQFFYIHPDNPQQRLINQAVEIVRKGGVIVYPTDSGYALGCKIEAYLSYSPAAGRSQLYPDVSRSF